jgi:hypothetical protein
MNQPIGVCPAPCQWWSRPRHWQKASTVWRDFARMLRRVTMTRWSACVVPGEQQIREIHHCFRVSGACALGIGRCQAHARRSADRRQNLSVGLELWAGYDANVLIPLTHCSLLRGSSVINRADRCHRNRCCYPILRVVVRIKRHGPMLADGEGSDHAPSFFSRLSERSYSAQARGHRTQPAFADST